MIVTVRYFAGLRDEAGTGLETLETSCTTVLDLWNDRVRTHSLTMEFQLVKPASDDEFCGWSTSLEPGMVVAFLPPVAGG